MIPFLSLKDVTALHGAEISEAVQRVVNSGWYLQGAEVKHFDENYAKYIGTQHCVGVANGLDALIWIYRAYIELGVMQPGDEVIVPANTYIASILALTENGLVPVLVEPRLEYHLAYSLYPVGTPLWSLCLYRRDWPSLQEVQSEAGGG